MQALDGGVGFHRFPGDLRNREDPDFHSRECKSHMVYDDVGAFVQRKEFNAKQVRIGGKIQ
jgi:hypothetical protein